MKRRNYFKIDVFNFNENKLNKTHKGEENYHEKEAH